MKFTVVKKFFQNRRKSHLCLNSTSEQFKSIFATWQTMSHPIITPPESLSLNLHGAIESITLIENNFEWVSARISRQITDQKVFEWINAVFFMRNNTVPCGVLYSKHIFTYITVGSYFFPSHNLRRKVSKSESRQHPLFTFCAAHSAPHTPNLLQNRTTRYRVRDGRRSPLFSDFDKTGLRLG